jgi:uncharacterized membrane protein YgcG
MREDIYTILEICLTMLDQGSDLEACLARYPDYASELRPLLIASMDAESLSVKEPPLDVVRRSKSKLLNIAAEMREQKSRKKAYFGLPVKRVFRISFVALITLLMVVGVGGTGLVSASTVALPGDQFYPVKITWEKLLLTMAVSQIEREVLEDRFERERVEEVEDLFSSSRSEKVKFFGQVDGIFPDQISVSGVPVVITSETRVDGLIVMNAWVQVEGETTPEGIVIAEKVKVESSRSEDGNDTDQNNSDSTPGGDDSGNGNGNQGEDDPESTKSPENDNEATRTNEDDNDDSDKSGSEDSQSTPRQQNFELEGIVSSYNGSSILVSDRSIFIIPATELRGNPIPGSQVSIRGYVNEEGVLIALRIDVKSSSGDEGGSGGGGGSSGGSDDDDDDPTKTPEEDD